ncbi:hypothetical protein D3C73_1127690 [compost metagenome]
MLLYSKVCLICFNAECDISCEFITARNFAVKSVVAKWCTSRDNTIRKSCAIYFTEAVHCCRTRYETKCDITSCSILKVYVVPNLLWSCVGCANITNRLSSGAAARYDCRDFSADACSVCNTNTARI